MILVLPPPDLIRRPNESEPETLSTVDEIVSAMQVAAFNRMNRKVDRDERARDDARVTTDDPR